MEKKGNKNIYIPRHIWRAGTRSIGVFVVVYGLLMLFVDIGPFLIWIPALLLLVYLNGVWRYRRERSRLYIEITPKEISGPGATRWSPRVTISRRHIDRSRTGVPTLFERILGYRNIYDKEGNAITLDALLLGQEQIAHIAKSLKLPLA